MGKINNLELRVLRGGSFYFSAPFVRSAYRNANRPDGRNCVYGYRLSRTYPERLYYFTLPPSLLLLHLHFA